MNISNLDDVPQLPGIYIWKDINENVLYIGKASNLKKRMSQYFLKRNKQNSYMTNILIQEINDFEYIITKDEKDALILESNLIKKYKPKYNILLIDDKGHRFIRIMLTQNKIDIKLVRLFKQDKASYFGPFPIRHNTLQLVKLLNSIANFENGLPIYNKDSNYWKEKYKLCCAILNPNNSKIKKEFKKKMKEAAIKQNYELANDYKLILKSLEFYLSKTIVELKSKINQDVWGVYLKDNYYSIYVMFYRYGKLLSTYKAMIDNDLPDSLRNYIYQFYMNSIKPDELLIDSKFLKPNDMSIKIVNPKIANGKRIIQMATTNARDNFYEKLIEHKKNQQQTLIAVNKLAQLLNYDHLNYIVMIDNSMTNNVDPVSGLVVYRNGIKQKHEYKKYNLVSRERKADVDYMKQVVERYLERTPSNQLPDLLILDGGKPQISEINKLLMSKNVKLNIIGLVKDKDHRTREIITSKYKVIKIDNPLIMNFLAEMQMEVDRFAKQHHYKRRRISSLEGKLLNIKGIGYTTETKLLNHFKTYSKIYNASIDELKKVVPLKIAITIKESLDK